MRSVIVFYFIPALTALAQLIPNGSPIPRGSKPPVVFLNGFQTDCLGTTFASTFGSADTILAANGAASVFFNNCSVPGSPSIEGLGAAFGLFLSGLRYQDGAAVDTVDVVAHSMGGLVVRSYLSGKQMDSGVFQPPAATHIRKAIFLATPHFGTGVALLFGFTDQLRELSSGSQFLFDLATWNQGAEDLRGVDAIAVAGNGGSGRTTTAGFDDGVVALTSASLEFVAPGHTRVLPYCHVDGGGLVTFAGLCGSGVPGIANFRTATQDTSRIMLSFLNGTTDWQSIGTPPERDPLLSVNGGLYVAVRSADDAAVSIDSVTAISGAGVSKQLNTPTPAVAYTDMFPAGPLTLSAKAAALAVNRALTLPAGMVDAMTMKPGPRIDRVYPAASAVFPLSVAPGMIVSIYGSSLAADVAQGIPPSLPVRLSDAQALVNGAAVPLYYTSPSQINAALPDGISGLVKLTVQTSSGRHTVNLLVEPAVPAIFTQGGTSVASALTSRNQLPVTSSNPLFAGDYLELYITGLGSTAPQNGLDVARVQPTVTIQGKDCPVAYAGRAPGYPGLDQINCVVPAGLGVNAAAQVVVVSGERRSQVATVAVE